MTHTRGVSFKLEAGELNVFFSITLVLKLLFYIYTLSLV